MSTGSYLQHLPAVFAEDPFLGRFLQAFETVLSGPGVAGQPGIEEIIGGLPSVVDPATTPDEFLPWLAGWVALSLRADWDAATKRAFLREIVPLYRLRGTQAGLQRMLEIYTRESVTIDDDFDDPAHFFQVQLTLGDADPDRIRAKQEIARAIIDQEKPAHTFYALKVAVPTMRLVSQQLQADEGGKPALLILGRNTILGAGSVTGAVGVPGTGTTSTGTTGTGTTGTGTTGTGTTGTSTGG
jgi:phage tail-like protein